MCEGALINASVVSCARRPLKSRRAARGEEEFGDAPEVTFRYQGSDLIAVLF